MRSVDKFIRNNKKIPIFGSDKSWINKSAYTFHINEYGHEVSRADWWRRWLYSTNAKDIGMLYIYFAIFSGIFIMPLQNLAICWEIIFNIWQSAGNLYYNLNIRFLRDFTQELSTLSAFSILGKKIKYLYGFLPNNVLHLHTNMENGKNTYALYSKDYQLGYYLAGLIEADGSIIIPREESKNTPTISISFNIEDKPLAVCIKNQLGFGFIENIEKK